jgi:PAS domain S-box-containing protein
MDAAQRDVSPGRRVGDGDPVAFLRGGGATGELIGAFDWRKTPLGEIGRWPQSLKTATALVLRSQVPIVMLWGEDGVMIYNDAYSIFAAQRHPRLLGSNVREGWPEVADFNDHVMKTCLAGDTLAYRDQELTLYRSVLPEQVFMNLDYSPVLDESGEPAGVIAIVVETTAKVAAERWQASERDRQRQMFEQAPGFVAIMSGPDHLFELTNVAYRQLVGHRDIIGLPIRKALPELEGQGFFELLDWVYTSGQPYVGTAMKVQIQNLPGAPRVERILDITYQPLRDPDDTVIGVFVQGVDVSERLAAEEALRRSEEQFRTFAESMPNHVWTARPDGSLDWLNPRVSDYSGLPAAELTHTGWTSIVHPDDLPSAGKLWEDARRTVTSYETEFRLRRHDGAYRWHIARAVPIRDCSGQVSAWIGTNTDIHDQKSAMQALSESERRLQLSQSSAGIASLELDIASGTVYGADGFWQLWGLVPKESYPIATIEELVIPEDRHIRSNEDTRRAGTAAPNVEYRIRRADTGELRWLSRSIDFVFDETGRPVKMFGVIQDITERKEAQARQELLTHELEHRIKNILAMVGAIASQTLRGSDIDTAKAAFGERLRALANAHDILNSTRWTKASVREVVENTMSAFPIDQISVSGPPLSINPRMALSLALAVNELGTNALKYGALSVPAGRVTIEWSQSEPRPDGTRELVWRWREAGGPPVTPPTRRGFGSFLIQRVLASDFGGDVQIDYSPTGLECVLTASLA